MDQDHLISHEVNAAPIEITLKQVAERIKKQGDTPHYTVEQQLDMMHQLAQFDFGCYLLQNQGINGYWTHYMTTHAWFGRHTGKNNRGDAFTPMEDFILNKLPIMRATQERMDIFHAENSKVLRDGVKLACIPCGMMGELLYLDYSHIKNFELIGIDYDINILQDARALAEKRQLLSHLTLKQSDAWNLNIHDELDLISSNGLTIYEPDDNRVIELFQQFYQALKPNGKLVTSFFTPPPMLTSECEWDMSNVNQHDLLYGKTVMVDIIGVKFQCYRSTKTTRKQLAQAGFRDIIFIYDKARMFPTVIAYK